MNVRDYDREVGCHYTLSEADFEEPQLERRDDGVMLATGICPRGDRVEDTPLDVPLCSGCDAEIVDGVCHGCQIIHSDLLAQVAA